MHRHDVIHPITVALSEVLGRDLPDLPEETRLFEDLSLDSTTILELLMALEDVLGVVVDPDTLEPDHFTTLGTLADYVISLQQVAAN